MAVATEQIIFGPFRCDPLNACMWREEQTVSLPPKAFDVLLHLLRHPGQLVSKEELLKTIWSDTYVGDAVLKVCVSEIRKALADDPKTPQFIETIHRRGYRWLAPLRVVAPAQGSGVGGRGSERTRSRFLSVALRLTPDPQPLTPILVGREADLTQLQTALEKALGGQRQIVFVTGEPGIGKTALIEAFRQGLEAGDRRLAPSPRAPTESLAPEVWVAWGQCIEHYGVGEAYLPVLEALGGLSRPPRQEQIVKWLEQYAPTWLAQMPALTSPAGRQRLRQEMIGATPERMLREGVEALEALTGETPLILILEDLHWSDYATLDLVAALARRREPARLLVIGTYRPVDVIVSGHPLKRLKQELQGHGQCEEIPLDLLAPKGVATYLTKRFPESALSAEVAGIIHQRTDGNPFFLVNVVEYLAAQGVFRQVDGRWVLSGGAAQIEAGIPESIRQMIERQIERLTPDEQQVLEAACVVGMEFTAAVVDAALEGAEGTSEEHCDRLARQQRFLHVREPKAWPDGTVTASYGFRHALYQSVLAQRVAAVRGLRLHQRIGERLEAAYGEQADTIAAELALHFEHGRDYQRAVKYLCQAAANDSRRYANREAIGYLSQALKLVERLPDQERRVRLHLEILHQLGLAYRAGGDLPEAAKSFTALEAVARAGNQIEWQVKALLHTATTLSWADHARCLATAEQAVVLSQQLVNNDLHVHARAYHSYWRSLAHGWHSEDVQVCIQAMELARRAGERDLLGLHLGRVLYFHCVQAQYRSVCHIAEEEMQVALKDSDAHSYMTCQFFRAWALLHAGRWGEMAAALRDGEQMVKRNQTPVWQTHFRLGKAWLCAQVGDWAQALELSADGLRQAREIRYKYSELLGGTLLGYAYLGLEDAEHAIQCFRTVSDRPTGVLIDLITQMALSLGLSEYWLAQKDYERARQKAERLCELAAQSGERTYLAHGRRMLADTALAQRKLDEAEQEVTLALSALDGGEAPLAEWRVSATAARVAERRHRKAQARSYWQRSKAVVLRLADSLAQDDPLRQTFLRQPAVRAVLRPD